MRSPKKQKIRALFFHFFIEMVENEFHIFCFNKSDSNPSFDDCNKLVSRMDIKLFSDIFWDNDLSFASYGNCAINLYLVWITHDELIMNS